MSPSVSCPKCQGAMTVGVLVDQGYGYSVVTDWQPGEPEVSRWRGLKVRKKELVPTRTFRCNRCGFLESYAKTPGR